MKRPPPFQKPGLAILGVGLALSILAVVYVLGYEWLLSTPEGPANSYLIPCGFFTFGLVLAISGMIRLLRKR
jgi:hypothetical protein